MAFVLAALIVAVDQWTKVLAESHLLFGVPQEVFSWFNLALAYNEGAAFSFMADMGGAQRWILFGVSALASIALIIWMLRIKAADRMYLLPLGSILGGAIGNGIDRYQTGRVVDFIQWHYGGYYFPTFNIADIAITCGAAVLLIMSFWFDDSTDEKAAA